MENEKNIFDLEEDSAVINEAEKNSSENTKKKSPAFKKKRKNKNRTDKKSSEIPDKALQDEEEIIDMSDSEETSINADESDSKIDAPSIDSLLLDGDDGVILPKEEENTQNFEEFLSDYKAKIGKSLAMAKSALQKNDEQNAACQDKEEAIDKGTETEAEEAVIEESDDGNAAQFTMNIAAPDSLPESTDSETKVRKYNPDKPRFIDTLFDFTELFIFTLTAVLIITTFFFKHTIVDGGSMEETLYNGEHLIISDLFYTPERGDIIVFADYSAGQKTPYVKRVIGLPGDKVKVSKNGEVTVNGEPLDESEYVFIDGSFAANYLGRECVVPEGEVFVLGDHRNASLDSATLPKPTIKIDSILGKVLFRIYPFDKFGLVD